MTTSNSRGVVGVDVGGANLKYAGADPDEKSIAAAFSRPFALWRQPQHLGDAIADDLCKLRNLGHRCNSLAVTMTGELADCFLDRAIGVDHIVAQVCNAARRIGVDEVQFYGVDGQFRDAEQASCNVDLIAAANWHALASFVADRVASDATLVDIGSTTTDIIPIVDGHIATSAMTDHDRLFEGSLVYVGCGRTPVCALVDELIFQGRASGVMNECFATIDDARLILRRTAEDANDRETADGMPRTRQLAANRLARMIGLDRRSVTQRDAEGLANQVVNAAKQPIHHALQKIHRSSTVVISGHGHDLIDVPAHNTVVRLSDILGAEVARCAPAHAVASLYARRSATAWGQCDE